MTKITVPAVNLPVSVESNISPRTNNEYFRISIDVDDEYSLKLFLTPEQAELMRVKLANSKSDLSDDDR